MPVPADQGHCRWLLLLLLPLLLGAFTHRAAAADCDAILAEAEEAYTRGRFDRAITLIEGCLDRRDLDRATRSRAYRLIGLTYIAKDYADKAREAVRSLLKIVPDYQPDPDQDPPPYVRLVEEVRRETGAPPPPVPAEKKKGGGWIKKALLGTGALVAAAIVYVVSTGGGGDETSDCPELPDPPGAPQ
jgi:tetratricopeptide (TPR) repeat protein